MLLTFDFELNLHTKLMKNYDLLIFSAFFLLSFIDGFQYYHLVFNRDLFFSNFDSKLGTRISLLDSRLFEN